MLAYYLASLGHSIVEKSGVLNLAIDGVFVLSVAVAFAQAIYTWNNPLIPVVISVASSIAVGLILVYTTSKLPVSHGAIGLSLMFLCYGLSGVIGVPARTQQGLTGQEVGYPISPVSSVWVLLYIVVVGLGFLLHYILERTKLGAMIKASGEDPLVAEALGVDVLKTRILAGVLGFALIGLGASAFELLYTRIWREGTGIGHGWIAFAVSLSSGRHPLLGIITAFLFALLYEYRFSILAVGLPREMADALPYITAITAMVIYMATPLKTKLKTPKSLGKPFFKEERTI